MAAQISRTIIRRLYRLVIAFGVALLLFSFGVWDVGRRDVKRPAQNAVADLVSGAQPGDILATLDTESHCLVEFCAGRLIPQDDRYFIDLGDDKR